MSKVPVTVADDLIKIIRLLAMTGRKPFTLHLYEPLDYAGWKRRAGNETARKLMERADRSMKSESHVHTVGPQCKRLISQAMHENLSALGDGSIFFLEKMQQSTPVSATKEAIEFVRIIHDPLCEFQDMHRNRSEQIFEESLQNLTTGDLREAFAPVDLGKRKIKVELQRQAVELFHKIKYASKDDDLNRCRKLIAAYLIKHGDHENNNREEIEGMIDALQNRHGGFRQALEDSMAIELYYGIQRSITAGDIKNTIIYIRKYAHIFQGNPDVKYFHEIDSLEQKLYHLISAKDLWDELKGGKK